MCSPTGIGVSTTLAGSCRKSGFGRLTVPSRSARHRYRQFHTHHHPLPPVPPLPFSDPGAFSKFRRRATRPKARGNVSGRPGIGGRGLGAPKDLREMGLRGFLGRTAAILGCLGGHIGQCWKHRGPSWRRGPPDFSTHAGAGFDASQRQRRSPPSLHLRCPHPQVHL